MLNHMGTIAAAVQLTVNGKSYNVEAEPETNLLEIIRDDIGLTGTKYGCGESMCGACTVLLDGTAVHSCITPLSDTVGKSITTIEGLEKDGQLHPLQQAFLDEGAMQCAYCVPGMIMKAASLLQSTTNPSDSEIIQEMDGNVCRCGGHPRMLKAIKRAAEAMRKGS